MAHHPRTFAMRLALIAGLAGPVGVVQAAPPPPPKVPQFRGPLGAEPLPALAVPPAGASLDPGGESAQPLLANTTCATAVPITCNGSVDFDNSAVMNPPDPDYLCIDPAANPDGTLWYKFVATSNSARIHTCNSLAEDSTFAVYDGCGSPIEIGRGEDNCGDSTYLSDDCVGGLVIGQTYYIQVSAWVPINRGRYTLEIDCPCPAAPVNIDCQSAEEIPCGGSVTFDNSGFGNPPLPCYSCGTGFFSDGTLWYRFTATGPTARIRTCDSIAQDSILAAYSGNCADLIEIGCSEDVCGANGYLSDITVPDLVPGQSYLIQVSAWGAAELGSYTLEVECGSMCPASSAPVPELIRNNAGQIVPSTKNRMLSFQAGDAGRNQAIRVTFDNLPAPYDAWNGRPLFAGAPFVGCETAGVGIGGACPSGAPTATFARLQCSPVCRSDWDQMGVVHVFHAGIVPGGTYHVDVVDCGCDVNDPASYSPELIINATRWGDVGGNFVNAAWNGPDGSISITTDVVATLEKFGNRTGAPSKTRADVEPACLDLKINIIDVSRVLDGFRGLRYPFPLPAADPCQAACP